MLPRSRAPALSVRRVNAHPTTALAPTVVQGQQRGHQQRQAAYAEARQSGVFFRPSGSKAVADKAAAKRAAVEKAAADKAAADKAAAEADKAEVAAAEAAEGAAAAEKAAVEAAAAEKAAAEAAAAEAAAAEAAAEKAVAEAAAAEAEAAKKAAAEKAAAEKAGAAPETVPTPEHVTEVTPRPPAPRPGLCTTPRPDPSNACGEGGPAEPVYERLYWATCPYLP